MTRVLAVLVLVGCAGEPRRGGADAEVFWPDRPEPTARDGQSAVGDDAGSGADSGAPDSADSYDEDVGTESDAGVLDSGAELDGAAYDSGTALDAGCQPDMYEPSEDPLSVPASSTGVGWSGTFAMTWHVGDGADWIRGDVTRAGTAIHIQAVDSDPYSTVTVRIRCVSSIIACVGLGPYTTMGPDYCEMTHREIADVDVACGNPELGFSAWAGVVRGRAACEHSVRVTTTVRP